MNYFHKPLLYSLFVTGLLASPAAWSENDCPSQECILMQTQLGLLRTQVKEANINIKKLETALNTAKQDISVLQNNNSNQLSKGSAIKPGFQSKVNGRGFRYRYSK